MKQHLLDALKRGLVAAGGGPLVLAIVYGILGQCGVITALSPSAVCTGILTVMLLAFISAAVGVVYKIERLPLLAATGIHAVVLYLDYLLIYLLNDWIPRRAAAIGIFTAVFLAGFALIWLCVLGIIRANTARLNRRLHDT